jgi:NAD(P)-dependent dehydrogenase (short-subunit alcohol dehydrogenase family)
MLIIPARGELMSTSRRRYVVTGSASGIGLATREQLEATGHRVIGVDLHDAEVTADLSVPEGRRAMVAAVAELSPGLEGVVACAGMRGQANDPEQIVRVNYFGALASLEGLRELLAAGDRPRAATTGSIALLREPIDAVVEACLHDDEPAALAATAAGDSHQAYTSSKLALARWARRAAPTDRWAGAGIALNVVAPGIVKTPMSDYLTGSDDLQRQTARETPQPYGTFGEPEHLASLLVWLTSAENGFVTGQLIFCDGGYEAITRGDVWP